MVKGIPSDYLKYICISCVSSSYSWLLSFFFCIKHANNCLFLSFVLLSEEILTASVILVKVLLLIKTGEGTIKSFNVMNFLVINMP